MASKAIQKLRYKFFKEFCPERLYVRYQIVSPYYTQAPSKERLIQCVEEIKNQGKKVKIGEVWWSMPTITTSLMLQIEEIIAMLFRGNSNDKFSNGLEYFIPSKDKTISKENGFYYTKSGNFCKQRDITIGGRSREEALLRLCLHDDIKPFIKNEIQKLFS